MVLRVVTENIHNKMKQEVTKELKEHDVIYVRRKRTRRNEGNEGKTTTWNKIMNRAIRTYSKKKQKQKKSN